MNQLPRYCRSKEEFESLREQLRTTMCDVCLLVGCVIRNGLVYGHLPCSAQRVVVGQRVVCSKRYGSKGCGRSFMVRLAEKVRGTSLGASELWELLEQLRGKGRVNAAWLWSDCQRWCTLATAYRLVRRTRNALAWVRTKLFGHCGLPASGKTGGVVLADLVEDLRNSFPAGCPVEEFQVKFQQGFLGPEPRRSLHR